ncbi:EAL domain-containing protein [Mesorhizobium sp. CAU 1741]|uniref:EAL domain-containing protein n=1 Tax=Mesorhizobium sp. CAU 1741 TaxID=3140366 RepID=UPI00325BF435
MNATFVSYCHSRLVDLCSKFGLRTVTIVMLVTIAVVADRSGWVDRPNNRLTDLRFELTSRAPSGQVVLIDIDGRSLDEINVWPWPRSLYADFVEKAGHLGVERLAFDIDFSALADPHEDQMFADALSTSKAEVFLAAFIQRGALGSSEFVTSLPHDQLIQYAWPAVVNVAPDSDGKVRDFPNLVRIGTEDLASLPVVLSNGTPLQPATKIDYSISAHELPRISFADFMTGEMEPESLSGKTLIVGATAIQLNDIFAVPVYGHVSGSTVIALATETLLQGRQLVERALPPLSLVLIGLFTLTLASILASRTALLVLLAASAGIEALAIYLQVVGNSAVQTAAIHLVLLSGVLSILVHEFDLGRLLLWVERINVSNARNMLERVIDDAFDAVIILDERGKIVRCNKRAIALLSAGTARHLNELPPQVSRLVREASDQREGGVPAGQPVELEISSEDGTTRTLEFSIVPFVLKTASIGSAVQVGDTTHVCVTARDVTARKQALQEITHMALHDGLTGAFNRRGLDTCFAQAIAKAEDAGWALLYFDLKGFKSVNDGFGQTAGDQILVEVVERTNALFPETECIARMGGDEFLILLKCAGEDEASDFAERLVATIDQPFVVPGNTLRCGARVGVRWWTTMEASIETYLLQADMALHKAKKEGRTILMFTPLLQIASDERRQFERELEQALEGDQFELAYQPQLDLKSGKLVGVEALLRWRHPVIGNVSPAKFVPVAEEMGLIGRLGFWVMKRACRDAAAWPLPIKVAVNVSAYQFRTRDVLADVKDAMAASHLPAERLEIEITESAFVDEVDRLCSTLNCLQDFGIRFALDDFGTGYSSLAYLHRFPISKIKIDQSFVRGLPGDAQAVAVLRSIQVLASDLGIKTIAEGVETTEQLQCLQLFGCNEVQGYLYARPMDNAALVDFMQNAQDFSLARATG